MTNNKIFDKDSIIYICIILFSISIILEKIQYDKDIEEMYSISYESVNIKNVTQPKIATKTLTVEDGVENLGKIEAINLESLPESVNQVKKNIEIAEAKKVYWHLPTQNGTITQYPHYGHVAYDITSWRGYGEVVYPVAEGTISGIYTDSYGALIVTVKHNIRGKIYTSQYVHLSSYAPGLYVGKEVGINDPLGQMGSTGYSTGPHLHITVLDCELFNTNDPNCPNLDSWYSYATRRYSENFYGLGALIYVPYSWNSR